MSKSSKVTCYTCTAFVIDVDKAYCEENWFENEPLSKAKTFEPKMFECVNYEKEPA